MPGQIFISYAHVDAQFVAILKQKLLDEQFNVWIDTDGIHAGTPWRDTIDEAIKDSFAVLVVLSPEACESKYVTYEWSYALGMGIPVIPLMFRQGGTVHERLLDKQYLEFTQSWSAPWEQLFAELSRLRLEQPTVETLHRTLSLLLEHARQKYEQVDLLNALDTLNEAVRIAPESLLDDVHFEMAQIYMAMKAYEEADEHLAKTLSYNRQHARALLASGELARRQADEADRAASEAEQEQNLAEAKAAREQVKKFLSRAEAFFREVLELQPRLLDDSNESVWASLGGILKRKGEIEAAIDAYSQAAKVRRTSYPHNNLGMLYMQRADLRRMRDNFGMVELFAQSAIQNDPGDQWAYNDLLTAQVILNKLNDARDTLDKVKIVAPLGSITSLIGTLESMQHLDDFSDDVQSFILAAMMELGEQEAYLRADA